jgi:hypothetical protein
MVKYTMTYRSFSPRERMKKFSAAKATPIVPPVYAPGARPMQAKMNAAKSPVVPPVFRPLTGPRAMQAKIAPASRPRGIIQRQIRIDNVVQTTEPPVTAHLNLTANTVTTHADYVRIVTGMINDGTPRNLSTGAWGGNQRNQVIAAIQTVITAEAAAAAAALLAQQNAAADALKLGSGSIANWNTLKNGGHASTSVFSHEGAEPKPGHAAAHVACYDINWTTSTGAGTRWCLHIHFLNANRIAANVESAHFKNLKTHAAGNNGAEISGARALAVVAGTSPIV